MSEEDFFGIGNNSYDPNEIITAFGNYKIKGDLTVIGRINTDKIKKTLFYNHTKTQFFLLKEYLSGKLHIDFFLNFDNVEPGIYFDYPGIFKVKIAFSISGDQKNLYFDFSKNSYIIESFSLGKTYVEYYQKERS